MANPFMAGVTFGIHPDLFNNNLQDGELKTDLLEKRKSEGKLNRDLTFCI